jgi:RNA polymerase sigma-70 factor (ECF subfamily)
MMGTRDTIWAELSGPLGKFIRRRVRDEHVAEDLLQDVMVKAQANIASAPEGERLGAWLFQIARNRVIDYYRSPKSRDVVGLGEEPAVGVEEEDADLTGELVGCLAPMIGKLPEPYREALVLADREGMTQGAVAERLGLSVPGAKSRVQRARRMLREMMVDCCAVETDRSGRVVDHHRTGKSEGYCGGAPGSCCDPGK